MMENLEAREGQRVIHPREGIGTITDIRGRHAAVVHVDFDAGPSKGVWIADLTTATCAACNLPLDTHCGECMECPTPDETCWCGATIGA